MKLFFTAAGFLAIIAYEAPGLVKNKEWRELGVFSGFMVLAMAVSIAAVLGLPVPNPNPALQMIFNPVTEMIKNLLS